MACVALYPRRRVKNVEIFLFAREVILFAQFCYLIFRLENDIMHNFEFGIQVMLIIHRDLNVSMQEMTRKIECKGIYFLNPF